MLRLKTLQLYSWPSRRKAILLWWYFLPFLDSRAHTNLPWEDLKKPPAKLDPHTQIATPGSNLNRNYSCLTQWFGSLRALNKHTAHTTNFMKVLVAGMPFCYQLLFLSLLTSICFQEGINFPISSLLWRNLGFWSPQNANPVFFPLSFFPDALEQNGYFTELWEFSLYARGFIALYFHFFHQLQTGQH